MSDDILGDTRFPLGIPGTGTTVKSVLCVPVLATPEGKCMAVVELFRDTNQDPFSAVSYKISSLISVIISTLLSSLCYVNDDIIHFF